MLDAERAIASLGGLAVFEHDHRGNRIRTLYVGNVVALNHPRHFCQPQSTLQSRQCRLGIFTAIPPGNEARGRVLGRKLHQCSPRSTLRDQNLHFLAALFAQPLRLYLGVGNAERQQNLGRRRSLQVVEQAKKARKDFVVGKFLLAEREGAISEELPLAHEEHHDLDGLTFAIEAEYVLIDEGVQHHPLRLQHRIESTHLIA